MYKIVGATERDVRSTFAAHAREDSSREYEIVKVTFEDGSFVLYYNRKRK